MGVPGTRSSSRVFKSYPGRGLPRTCGKTKKKRLRVSTREKEWVGVLAKKNLQKRKLKPEAKKQQQSSPVYPKAVLILTTEGVSYAAILKDQRVTPDEQHGNKFATDAASGGRAVALTGRELCDYAFGYAAFPLWVSKYLFLGE